MFWRWGMMPWVTSRMAAAWTRVVWAPFAFRSSWVSPKWSRYSWRADSSSRERSPSSRVFSTAVSQARTRSWRRSVFDMLVRRRVLSSSWRAAPPSPLARGARPGWVEMRSEDARSRVAEPVITLGRSWLATRSRKSRRFVSSCWVRMPSLMACWTPWAQPFAIAWEISSSVARARAAIARRVLRRAVSLKPAVPAAWAASWVISWMPVAWRSRHWPCCLRRKPAFWLQKRQVPFRNWMIGEMGICPPIYLWRRFVSVPIRSVFS